MMAKTKTNKEVVEVLVSELIKLLGLTVDFEVTESDEAIAVEIKTEKETGLLIGKRGETLAALQNFLNLALRHEDPEAKRVVVNIGDYRQKQEEYLRGMARTAAQRAKTTGVAQNLYNLTPAERRIVHLELAEDSGVETASEGEGEERYLVIKKK